MSDIADLGNLGYLPLQCFDTRFAARQMRPAVFGVRIDKRDATTLGRYKITDGTAGDLLGFTLWQPVKGKRATPAWAACWPAVSGSAGGAAIQLLPAADAAFNPDRRFKILTGSLPSWSTRFPSGYPGMVAGTTEDTKQVEAFSPGFFGLFVANRGPNGVGGTQEGTPDLFGNVLAGPEGSTSTGGSPDLATLVSELGGNAVDELRQARLHSAFRVVRPDNGKLPLRPNTRVANALAWNLDYAGRDKVPGLGAVFGKAEGPTSDGLGASAATQTAPATGVIALMSSLAAGPLSVGGYDDKHRIAVGLDDEPVNAGHLSGEAYVYHKFGDGPFHLEDASLFAGWPKGTFGTPTVSTLPNGQISLDSFAPIGTSLMPVHCFFDRDLYHGFLGNGLPGKWRWFAESPIYLSESAGGLTGSLPTPGKTQEKAGLKSGGKPGAPGGGPPGAGAGGRPPLGPPSGPGAPPRPGGAGGGLPIPPPPPPAPDPAPGPPDTHPPQTGTGGVPGPELEPGDAHGGTLDPPDTAVAIGPPRIPGGDPVSVGPITPPIPQPPAESVTPPSFDSSSMGPRDNASGGHEPFVGFVQPIATSALLARSQAPWTGDLSKAVNPRSEELAAYMQTAPITGRLQSYGAQDALVTSYGQPPCAGRYAGGTASGGFVLTPPELDAADVINNFAPPGVNPSSTYQVAAPGASFGVGTPDTKTGHMIGHRWTAGDGKKLTPSRTSKFQSIPGGQGVDASGNPGGATDVLQLSSTGAEFPGTLQLPYGTEANVKPSNPAPPGFVYVATDTNELMINVANGAWNHVAQKDRAGTISKLWTFNPGAAQPPFAVTQAVSTATLVANLNAAAWGSVTVSGTPSANYIPAATSSSAATWQTLLALLDAWIGTTRGVLPVRGASAWGPLALGAANTLLTSNGLDPAYQTLSTIMDNVVGSSQGQLVQRSASSWSSLSPGAAGTLLASQGASANLAYVTLSSAFDTAFSSAARGDIITRGASTWGRTAVGAANTIVSSDGTDTKFQTLSALVDGALGSTRGGLLERGASGWQVVAPGTTTRLLMSQGAGADLVWEDFAAFLALYWGSSRGQIMYQGPGSPGWNTLALGATNSILSSNGTDLGYQSLSTLLDGAIGSLQGEIAVRGASTWSALAHGTADQVLATDGTDVLYRSLGTLLDNVFSSTRGAILRRGSSAWQALAHGTANQLLSTDGTDALYQSLTTILDGAVSSVRGALAVRGASAWQTLALGAANTIVSSDGTDTKLQSLTTLLDSLGSTRGQMLYRGASAWVPLSVGTNGQVLTSNGTDPAWSTAASSESPANKALRYLSFG